MRALLGSALVNLAIVGNGAATGILAARLLGPEDRGLFAVMQFWPQLLSSIFFLSLGEALVYQLNRTTCLRPVFITTGLVLALMLAGIGIVTGSIILPIVLGPHRSTALDVTWLYLVAFIPVSYLGLTLLAVRQGAQQFFVYNLLQLVPAGVYLVGMLTLYLTHYMSVTSLLGAMWVGTCLTAMLAFATMGAWPVAGFSWTEAQALLRRASSFHGATILVIITSAADRIVLMTLFDDAAVGHYTAALTLSAAGLAVAVQAAQTVLFPRLAAETSRAAATTLLSHSLRRLVMLLVPSALAMSTAAYVVVQPLFGASFKDAESITAMLSLAYAPLALRQVILYALRAFGDGRSGLIAEALALCIFAATIWPLANQHGPVGIALSLLIANLGALAWLVRHLQCDYDIQARTWLLPSWTMLADVRDFRLRIILYTRVVRDILAQARH